MLYTFRQTLACRSFAHWAGGSAGVPVAGTCQAMKEADGVGTITRTSASVGAFWWLSDTRNGGQSKKEPISVLCVAYQASPLLNGGRALDGSLCVLPSLLQQGTVRSGTEASTRTICRLLALPRSFFLCMRIRVLDILIAHKAEWRETLTRSPRWPSTPQSSAP